MGFLAAGLALLATGCQCQPEIQPPPDDTETTTTGTTGVTGDTAPPPPCAVPELEPNDDPTAPNELLLERQGCGTFDRPLDLDHWAFTLDDDGWVSIELEAGNGSIADTTVILAPEDNAWAASRADDPDSTDATLRFPAPAGTYVLTVGEQNFQGGDRYAYGVLVSEDKPAVDWTTQEVEPNDDAPTALQLTAGDRVWGVIEGGGLPSDQDWYRVIVPEGKHTLTVEVTAYSEGSAADLTVFLYDDAIAMLPAGCKNPCPRNQPACVDCAITGGVGGEALDPVGEYDSEGNEIVYVQVLEAANREGPAAWYVLTIDLLEGS